VKIEGVEIGLGHPCRTVAELSNNHNGDFDRALRLIHAAKKAGADFVKFQCYTPDELVALRGDGPAPEPWGSSGWTMRTLYKKAATPLEWFPDLFATARAIGIVPFSSVFGPESLAVLESVECPAYKIARLDNRASRLRDAARATTRPILVSRAPDEKGPRWRADLTLLCPVGYPQTEFRLRGMFDPDTDPYARSSDRDFDGFSYHGTNPSVPALAATIGASLVECHFQLDDEPSELEANVSLTASQFARMVEDIRKAEEVLG
jgi:pseudaminic acid synthase